MSAPEQSLNNCLRTRHTSADALFVMRLERIAFPNLLTAVNRISALLYPEICQVCHAAKATPAEGYVCPSCWTKPDGVHFIVEPYCRRCGLQFEGEITGEFECANCRDSNFHFRSARAAVRLSGLVQDVLHRYKYNHASWFEPFLADLLIRQAVPVLQTQPCDLIVPIPLHWLKYRERSFNQSERLARRLGKVAALPVNSRLIRRRTATATQTRLNRIQRAENVKRAFAFRPRKPLSGERILLIDDVLTTGATANACANVLMQNGAGSVHVWTVARGLLQ